MTGEQNGGPTVPVWLRAVGQPSDELFEALDARRTTRQLAVDALSNGLIANDHAAVVAGLAQLTSLPVVPSTPWTAEDSEDPLVRALQGRLTTQDLLDAFESGSWELSEEQAAFAPEGGSRLRVLALSLREDLDPDFLESDLFPMGNARVTVAARGSGGHEARLAEWLDEHPELTGIPQSMHWRG